MTTRIDTLELQNFRLFRELSISFHPELTVLVAPNGGGKTAILDALAIALYQYVYAIRNKNESHPIKPEDVRLGRDPRAPASMIAFTPTVVRARGSVDDNPTEWSVERVKDAKQTSYLNAQEAVLRGESLQKDLQAYADGFSSTPPVLPTIAYYGTGRLWHGHRRTAKKKQIAEDLRFRIGAYADCLSSSSSYANVMVWFGRVVGEALKEQQSGRVSPHQPQVILEAMRGAIDSVLRPSGWHRLDWDLTAEEMVAEHSERGTLSVDALSDGVRNLIALVADLAHRAIRLNPQFGAEACKMSPGIVLIDEVDMHLHPAWQQTILASLHEAFPKIQFIVTTHSHLVVSTVPSECVRILHEDGTVSQPSLETQGYDSPLTLGVVFGVDSTPPIEIAKQLSHYRALVEQGQSDTDEARSLQTILEKHFGTKHPAMLEAESLRRLQDFKAKMAAKRGGN